MVNKITRTFWMKSMLLIRFGNRSTFFSISGSRYFKFFQALYVAWHAFREEEAFACFNLGSGIEVAWSFAKCSAPEIFECWRHCTATHLDLLKLGLMRTATGRWAVWDKFFLPFRSFIASDLEFVGIRYLHHMNITDVTWEMAIYSGFSH